MRRYNKLVEENHFISGYYARISRCLTACHVQKSPFVGANPSLQALFAMVPTPQQVEALVYAFCQADRSRTFNFTSGHLGNLPMTDEELREFLAYGRLPQKLSVQCLRFVIGWLLPFKSFVITGRALLRRHFSRPLGSSHALCVLSLGDNAVAQDPYFGKLLQQTTRPFDYLKVVGGGLVRSDKYHFVETVLSRVHLCLAILFAPAVQLFFLLRLLQSLERLPDAKVRKLFALLALGEINTGGALNQALIVCAMRRQMRQGRTLLYPLEGRNWEKGVAASAHRAGARSIGYLHCALTPRHLSLLNPGFLEKHEWPNTLITPGEMATQRLAKTHRGLNVRQGYFLRGGKPPSDDPQRGPYLLFALTGNIRESEEILRNIAVFAKSSRQSIVIRLNPNTSTFPYLRQFTLELGLSLYEPKEVALPQLCFFRSSSVAIDYLRNDVVPIYLDTSEFISTNIFELDDKFPIESVRIDSAFGDNVACLMQKHPLGQAFDGRSVANYYLDQEFSERELSALLTSDDQNIHRL